MSKTELTTKQNIMDAAKKEFLQKGFKNASLRNIVKSAGVTTGAFYGYFSSKESLFSALVEPYAVMLMSQYVKYQNAFESLPETEQPKHMGMESVDCMNWAIDYIYDNFDAFKLLICCSEGTAYSHLIDDMANIEIESTYKFIQVYKKLGHKIENIDSRFCHIIISGMFNSIFEVVVHNMPKEQAKLYIKQLQEFYTAGWKKIIGF